MARLKNKKSIRKRVKVTANAKIMHEAPGQAHLLTRKDNRSKNRRVRDRLLSKDAADIIKKGLIGV